MPGKSVQLPYVAFSLVVCMALVVSGATAGVPTLVLHLPFEDGMGSATAADVTGNGHDGTLVNMDVNMDWVSGRAGLALDFDGSNDYVSVPDDAALDFGTGDFSVVIWVYKRSATVGFDNNYGVSILQLIAIDVQNYKAIFFNLRRIPFIIAFGTNVSIFLHGITIRTFTYGTRL